MLNKEDAFMILNKENLDNFNFKSIAKFDLTNKGLMLIDCTKPLSQSMLPFCQLDPKEHISVRIYWTIKSFSREKAIETIFCEIAAILSRPQCVKVDAWNQKLPLVAILLE